MFERESEGHWTRHSKEPLNTFASGERSETMRETAYSIVQADQIMARSNARSVTWTAQIDASGPPDGQSQWKGSGSSLGHINRFSRATRHDFDESTTVAMLKSQNPPIRSPASLLTFFSGLHKLDPYVRVVFLKSGNARVHGRPIVEALTTFTFGFVAVSLR